MVLSTMAHALRQIKLGIKEQRGIGNMHAGCQRLGLISDQPNGKWVWFGNMGVGRVNIFPRPLIRPCIYTKLPPLPPNDFVPCVSGHPCWT